MADTESTKDALFTQMAAEAGMPTTEAEMRQAWAQCNVEAGSPFSNSSEFSPFWRLVSAIAPPAREGAVSLPNHSSGPVHPSRHRSPWVSTSW